MNNGNCRNLTSLTLLGRLRLIHIRVTYRVYAYCILSSHASCSSWIHSTFELIRCCYDWVSVAVFTWSMLVIIRVYLKGLKWFTISCISFHSYNATMIDIFKVLGCKCFKKKENADLDASRRILVRSIFINLVAALQAEILAIKQLWGSPKYIRMCMCRKIGTLDN